MSSEEKTNNDGYKSNFKNIFDSILVGVDFTQNDEGVLVVGRKRMNQSVEIINTFQGQEAWDLYQKLITVESSTQE